MAILFAGTSNTDFPGDHRVTTSGLYIADTVKEALYLNPLGSEVYSPYFTPQTELWVTFSYRGYSNGSNPFLYFGDSSGVDRFRLKRTTSSHSSTIDAQVWNGSSWVDLFVTANLFDSRTVTRFDVRVKLDAVDGAFELYINKTLEGSFSGDTTGGGLTPLSRVAFYTVTPSYYSAASAIIVSDVSTIPKTFVQLEWTANGANTDWLGNYPSLNGAGFSSETTILAANVEDISTFVKEAIPAPYDVAHSVDAVVLSVRGKHGASNDIISAIRSSGVDYEGPSFNLTDVFSLGAVYLPTNPNTGVAWTVSEVDSAEFGVKLKNA